MIPSIVKQYFCTEDVLVETLEFEKFFESIDREEARRKKKSQEKEEETGPQKLARLYRESWQNRTRIR